MKTVLLDTDYVIDFMRGIPLARKHIVPLLQEDRAYLSILSVYELYAGMRSDEQKATDDFINACRIEPVTMDIAKNAGAFRFSYRQKGITLSIVDCIIAETARIKNHQVATHNKKHYPESSFLDTNDLGTIPSNMNTNHPGERMENEIVIQVQQRIKALLFDEMVINYREYETFITSSKQKYQFLIWKLQPVNWEQLSNEIQQLIEKGYQGIPGAWDVSTYDPDKKSGFKVIALYKP